MMMHDDDDDDNDDDNDDNDGFCQWRSESCVVVLLVLQRAVCVLDVMEIINKMMK